jgi:hypothetical protein
MLYSREEREVKGSMCDNKGDYDYDFKIVFRNRKWNYLNRKWNHISPF